MPPPGRVTNCASWTSRSASRCGLDAISKASRSPLLTAANRSSATAAARDAAKAAQPSSAAKKALSAAWTSRRASSSTIDAARRRRRVGWSSSTSAPSKALTTVGTLSAATSRWSAPTSHSHALAAASSTPRVSASAAASSVRRHSASASSSLGASSAVGGLHFAAPRARASTALPRCPARTHASDACCDSDRTLAKLPSDAASAAARSSACAAWNGVSAAR
mmetsp:Transcript_17987/g.72102  ORF Transcript_17987/g.72102 Transcript_17987/m.72102 type:complete len:222 (-) Transcript_17987:245-910(-)